MDISLPPSLPFADPARGRMQDFERMANHPLRGSNLSDEEKKKLAEAARGFESMFVSMLMKNMRAAMLEEDEQKGDMSFGADTLQGYTDLQFGDYVAARGSLGLANQIYNHVTGEKLPTVTDAGTPFAEFPAATKAPTLPQEPAPANAEAEIDSPYAAYIREAAEKYDVDPRLISAVINAESSGRSRAVSPAGAKGLMQLMDGTARAMGVKNSFDPRQNIDGGTKYLKSMLDTFRGDHRLALAAYNAGPGAVQRFGGVPPFSETRRYVNNVVEKARSQGMDI